MTTVNRVDQAILLLKDRLRRLEERSAGPAARSGAAAKSGTSDPLVPLRQLARRGDIPEPDLRRALVRALLADSFGGDVVGSLEFQSIADQVTRILEDSEVGQSLLQRVLTELQ